MYAQKQLIDKTLEEIDSLKHYIESLLMSEESSSRTGLEVHDPYKKSVFRTVFYLELINELETRSFDSVTEHIYNIDRILSGIRSSLETPDKGVEKMRENPATGYLFIPFDHIESNITYNNYDFFDEFKTTVNIKAALEAHRIDTILNENFHEQLFIDRKIYADYLEKKKNKH